jgi:CRISPR-associated protein Cas8a2/Csx9 subtype I-A
MIDMMLYRLPFTGLLRELISIGLLELAENNILIFKGSELNERVANVMENASNAFENEFSQISSSKILLNDINAYFKKTKRLVKWYGKKKFPEDYIGLMIYALRGTSKLLKKKKVNFVDSIQSINIGKKVILGNEYNNSLAITPGVIKQAEFYEFQHEFLKPTAGKKPEILLDPIWFALMAIGFLRCFAGYYDGKYYFITKEGIETILKDPSQVHTIFSAIESLVASHIKIKPTPCCEELYELKLSYGIASGEKIIPKEVYPLKMYEISFIGNAYTCTRTMLIDLAETVDYLSGYINYLRSMFETTFMIKIGEDLQYDNPIHALLDLAEREIYKPVKGDNSMILLTFVKDLYRAIHTGRANLIEEILLKLLRIFHSILIANREVNLVLRKTIEAFMHEQHIKAIIYVKKEIERY